MRTLIDLKAFGLHLYAETMLPEQGWHLSAERVPGGCAFWFGPLHGALCRA